MALTETWLPVPGYIGSYEVSDQGRVRSITRTVRCSDGRNRSYSGHILTQTARSKSGHMEVTLSLNGKSRGRLVHQLVLNAFVGPCPPGHESLHANDIPSDNRLINLSYGTRSQNVQDQVRNGRHNQASKDTCNNGHEFTEENTYRRPGGGRRCRACQRHHGARWNLGRAS